MKRSQKVLLLITGSVVLAACGRPSRPADGSPTPTPTPGPGGYSGGGGHALTRSHWWSSSRSWGSFGGGDASGSHSISRGGFGGHAGAGT